MGGPVAGPADDGVQRRTAAADRHADPDRVECRRARVRAYSRSTTPGRSNGSRCTANRGRRFRSGGPPAERKLRVRADLGAAPAGELRRAIPNPTKATPGRRVGDNRGGGLMTETSRAWILRGRGRDPRPRRARRIVAAVVVREFVRALPVAIETTGRVVEGVALTYDRAYRVSDDGGRSFYHEGWRPGAFTDGLAAIGNTHEARRRSPRTRRVGVAAFDDSARGRYGSRSTADGHRSATPCSNTSTPATSARYRYGSSPPPGAPRRRRVAPRRPTARTVVRGRRGPGAVRRRPRDRPPGARGRPGRGRGDRRRAAATAALVARTRENLAAGARLL